MVKRYRKKPVEVEAILWTCSNKNIEEMKKFLGGAESYYFRETKKLSINTLEGFVVADIGDYISKGVAGEFYPCKPDIFKKTYEEVGNE